LALLGSGEFLCVMDDLDRRLLAGRAPRVVHLPTAAGQEGARRLAYWRELAAEHFGRLGVEVETVEVVDRHSAHDPKLAGRVKGAGLVYLSGGNPRHLVSSLRGSPVWDAVLDVWHAGAGLAGCSAGAMAMAGVLPALRAAASEALGLLPTLSVIPHYDRFGKMMRPAARLHEKNVIVVGIDENTAMYGGPDEWTVHGAGMVHVSGAGARASYPAGSVFRTD
jgi:cyanophycinase